MSRQELRAEARIAVTRRGELSTGYAWFPCTVLDMSNNGFLMAANKQLAVGQILEFRCELYPGEVLDCMTEVMHSNDESAGVMITEIDENGTRLLQTYLEQQNAVKLDTLTKAGP